MESNLTAQGVCKSFGKKAVLRDINLTFEPGKIYGLLGRNGAGKTTLMSALSAQMPVSGGAVRLGDAPVWENARALREICFVREGIYKHLASMRVREYIKMAQVYRPAWDKDYADRLLKEFGIEGKQRLARLSKGEQSAVNICVALACRAPYTFLDEPVAGLDVAAREKFYALLLDDYAETQRTFVISTHIIDEAAKLFENLIVLQQGQVQYAGSCEGYTALYSMVSGMDTAVDALCEGLTVVHTDTLAHNKTVCVRASQRVLREMDAAAHCRIEPAELQKVFVYTTQDAADEKAGQS